MNHQNYNDQRLADLEQRILMVEHAIEEVARDLMVTEELRNTLRARVNDMRAVQELVARDLFGTEDLRNNIRGGDDLRAVVEPAVNGTSRVGLSEEKISENLQESITQGKDKEVDVCSICLSEYEENQKKGTLDCGHGYHAECIKRWLLRNNVCPLCRSTALAV